MDMVERIKTKCREKSTTMGTLEKELNLGNGTIRRWDERIPSIDRVQAVANRLEVSIDWLLTGKEPGELTEEEKNLVNCYRNCNTVGKQLIREHAASIREKLPTQGADNDEETARISTSAVG